MKKMEQQQPQLEMKNSEEYREGYANSVQVRVTVWDFHLTFGTAKQDNPAAVEVSNFQGIYLSPQQAKAMWNVLGQNLAQYERTFGTLTLEPAPPAGPVN
jgi:hypothetical protein